ncbi:MAG TPA: SprB repeat-containing protein [Bacteroidia bacterium]|nr:SprB repeat-containing protein [Bacteroidia bacterium]HRH07270.1 SprB repeat-containing protein [Bacteroidia bacterium]
MKSKHIHLKTPLYFASRVLRKLGWGGVTKFLIACSVVLLLNTSIIYAQSFEVQLNPSMYAGGYNISCYGSNNGSINTYIMGGIAPFTFVWNTGATTKNLSNLSAGSYSVTVTSSTGNVATAQISLIQPDVFTVDLTAIETAPGYHISEFGAHDGQIQSTVNGGVPPYNYLWSSGETIEAIGELTAGTYSLTVHDATNCVSSAATTLIEPTALHVVSISSPKVIGNYNIGCTLPGSINLVVAGGVTPYTFEWEGGANTQNLSGLTEANSYGVIVRDESGGEVRTSITLTASPQISAQTTPFVYPNTKNTSCYNCNNGSITTSFSSGTAPYTFSWNNGATVQNPSNLAAGLYSVLITDAAGCSIEKTAILTAPEREDWTMNGNAGTNPTTQFLGTSDSVALVFKAKNKEIFRLMPEGNGYAKFSKLIAAEAGIALNNSKTVKISYDSIGGVKTIYFGKYNSNSTTSCITPNVGNVNQKFDFQGFLASRPDNASGFVNSALIMGSAPWDGSGIIEVEGTDQNGGTTNGLLLNYYCGRNIALCTNPAKGGFVSTGKFFEVGYPFPSQQSNIAANIKGTDQTGLRVFTEQQTAGYTTQFISDNDQSKLISAGLQNSNNSKEVFLLKADGTLRIGSDNSTDPTVYISPSVVNNAYQNGKVGIGTNQPNSTLDVHGDVRISSLANNGIRLLQTDNDGIVSSINTSNLSALGLWQTNGTDVYRLTGNVGIGNSTLPTATLDIIGPSGAPALKVVTTSDPTYNTQLISSSLLTKLISGNLTLNNQNNEIFSINSDGKTVFGNPNNPTFYISPVINNSNTYTTGKVGIATSNPTALFQVGESVTSVSIGDFFNNSHPWTTNYVGFNASREHIMGATAPPYGTWKFNGDDGLANAGAIIAGSLKGDLRFISIGEDAADPEVAIYRDDNVVLSNVRMTIHHSGIVSIGTSLTATMDPAEGYKLYVNGGIKAEKIKVEVPSAHGWADFVFDENYKNMPLPEIEKYIKTYKHLPGIPSECEVKENGVDIVEMQVKLLKSLEELTLHLIELEKENAKMKLVINKITDEQKK